MVIRKRRGAIVEYREPTVEEREELLQMILDQLGGHSESAMTFLGLTPEQFAQIYRTTGEVRVVRDAAADVGYVWIEERDRTLHVHAIILRPSARGRGIGTRVLQALVAEFASRVDEIELGVQDANAAAVRFYERLGFRKIAIQTAPEFSLLRLPLNPVPDEGGDA